MHPVLFRLPIGDWPVRLFGLFIIAAFLLCTLWAQWRYAITVNPAFREEKGLRKAMRLMVPLCLLNRILFILIPIEWSSKVVGVWIGDMVIWIVMWRIWAKAVKKHGNQEAEFLFNTAFWLLIIGFLGSRIFWVVTTPSGRATFADSPLRALFFVWDGGIVWYGGLLLAAAFGVWYVWVKEKNILELGDILMVGIPLALFIGRWACLSAGDDYGKLTDQPWGIVFPNDPNSMMPARLIGHAVHPTQLYMSLNGLIIFFITAFVLDRKRFHGQVVYLSLLLYAVGRFIIEIYRGDETRGLYDLGRGTTLSSSQLISIPVFLVALILYVRGWSRSRREPLVPAAAEDAPSD